MKPETLRDRLRDALDTHKPPIRPSDLARACDVSPQAVNGWLKTGRIDKRYLVKIARATDQPVEFFLDPIYTLGATLGPLKDDELQLIRDYRAATDGWRLTLRLMARTPIDEQPQLSRDLNILMTTIFGTAVPDDKVEAAYGKAGTLHDSAAPAYPVKKKD